MKNRRPARTSAPRTPGKPPTGRPGVYTEELATVIIDDVVRHGCDFIAAEANGLSRDTLYTWRVKAAKGEEPYADFVRRLDQAKAVFIGHGLERLSKSRDLNHLSKLIGRLERQLSEKYQVEITAKVQHSHVPPESAEAFRAEILGIKKPEAGE